VWGTLWSVVGATLGAIAAFAMARFLMGDWAERRWGRHSALQKLKGMIRGNMFHCVLVMRLNPIAPFNLLNFLFGLTPIDLKPYALGTCLGITPGTLAYTWLGASGARAWRGDGLLQLFLALGLLAGLTLLPIVLKGRRT
jgi:uncharacterized membrane protein YdjX (TVP38/TMEM64 family)